MPPRNSETGAGPGRTVAAGILALLAGLLGGCGQDESAPAAAGEDLERGATLFANNCAVCHGPQGDGTLQGPPLVHEIYEPGHHPDESFQTAVAQGVPQHHWDFGPMPAIAGLDRTDVADITAYVRELQREAGIID